MDVQKRDWRKTPRINLTGGNMDFNYIPAVLPEGWGKIYQGGTVDEAIKQLPSPLVIVCMDKGEDNNQWLDGQAIRGVMSICIDDSPDAILPDAVLVGITDACISYLRNGTNLYIHCAAGISRSSYCTASVLMRALKLSFDAALAVIRSGRPQANPNSGFTAQLQRLESTLNG